MVNQDQLRLTGWQSSDEDVPWMRVTVTLSKVSRLRKLSHWDPNDDIPIPRETSERRRDRPSSACSPSATRRARLCHCALSTNRGWVLSVLLMGGRGKSLPLSDGLEGLTGHHGNLDYPLAISRAMASSAYPCPITVPPRSTQPSLCALNSIHDRLWGYRPYLVTEPPPRRASPCAQRCRPRSQSRSQEAVFQKCRVPGCTRVSRTAKYRFV